MELDGAALTATTPVVVVFRANRFGAKLWRANILGPASSKCQLYVGAITPTQYRDGSSSGAADVAEYPNGLSWPSGMQLFFVWDKAGSANVHIEFEPA